MSKSGRSLMVALLSVSLLAANVVEAARLGGGRSTGMQRSQVTRSAPQPAKQVQQTPPQQQPMQQPAQAAGQQRSGPGWGGVAAGAVGGAAVGYMAAKAMEPNQSGTAAANNGAAQQQLATQAPAQQGGGTPWLLIILLGALAFFGARWFMRRQAVGAQGPALSPAGGFDASNQGERKVFRMGEGMSAAPQASTMTRLPDGTETAAFLRQVRASFQHIQSLNSVEQMEEVRKYLTPELFEELKAEIGSNREVAEFSDLQADLLDSSREDGRLVASVRFSGRVSESLNAPAVPFAEVWHFVRPTETDPRWVLAGIEQV